MKIITRSVIKIETLEVMEQESFEYSGPIALCYTEGSESSSTSVDSWYNQIIARLQVEEHEMAAELYDYYKYGQTTGYSPVEMTKEQKALRARVKAGDLTAVGQWNDMKKNMGWVVDPATGELSTRVHSGTSQQQLESAQTAANMELLPQQTELEKQKLSADLSLLPKMTEVKTSLMDQALKGLDITGEMNRAQAGVEQASGIAGKSANNIAFRNQWDKDSGQFYDLQKSLLLNKAKGIAGARTAAKLNAENINFGRLATVAGM